jgi:hypothetical protein
MVVLTQHSAYKTTVMAINGRISKIRNFVKKSKTSISSSAGNKEEENEVFSSSSIDKLVSTHSSLHACFGNARNLFICTTFIVVTMKTL